MSDDLVVQLGAKGECAASAICGMGMSANWGPPVDKAERSSVEGQKRRCPKRPFIRKRDLVVDNE